MALWPLTRVISLSTTPGRAREWLLGRACIKEAVRWWIHADTGTLVHPAEVVVHHDELGAPWVDGWWDGVLVDAPAVSLAHDDQVSLAAVTQADRSVGIDVEHGAQSSVAHDRNHDLAATA